MKNCKKTLLLGLFTCCMSILYAQQKGVRPLAQASSNVSSGITRAVVVGISDYQNPAIPDLQFADKDATIFANYLTSKDGGGLLPANVKLLINEQATAGQFVGALYSLLEESKEGDQVIIYFSGHGDVESSTKNQPGFLLCWDAPAKVYMGGGTFGLSYLQEIISTLSLQNKCMVTMVTDACRAGKLAGSSIGGAQATAASLSTQYANEVKILSCQPNEFALEGLSWGGGRGLFSYYLLNGIQGLADKNKDETVSLSEIGRYLEDNVTSSAAPHNQTPMVIGDRNAKIANVNPAVLALLQAQSHNESINTIAARAVSTDGTDIQDTSILKKYLAFNEALKTKHLLYPSEGSAWSIYEEIKDVKAIQAYTGLMKRNLAASLQDDAQQAINDYLESKPKELYDRWQFNPKYAIYPEMLNKAAELLGNQHFYYKALKSRELYFYGLNARLEAERTESRALFLKAISYQDSSLLFDTEAPFALNEKGYTLSLIDKNLEAIAYYEKALNYTPKWANALANICGSYAYLKEYDKAISTCETALSFDTTSITAINNLALSYFGLRQMDKAKLLLKKGIIIDPNFPPFYSMLGLIGLKENNIDDAFYYMSRCYQLDSSVIETATNLGRILLQKGYNERAKKAFLRARTINPKSLESIQGLIEYYFYTSEFDSASQELESYVKQYPDDNFSLYLISSISAGKGDKTKSLDFLEQALKKGFKQKETLNNDANFAMIKNSPEYKALLDKYLP